MTNYISNGYFLRFLLINFTEGRSFLCLIASFSIELFSIDKICDQMFELGKLYIPTLLVFDPVTRSISFKIPEIYSEAYFDQVQNSLELKILGSEVEIDYYGEDDTYLSQVLNLDAYFVTSGSLEAESLGTIQEKALKVLQEHMLNPRKELLDFFNGIEGDFATN